MNSLSSLSEKQLLARFVKLGRIQKTSLVSLVLVLAEVHHRRIHLAAGYPTLADYARAVLKEERRKAWRLGLAAEAVANFPLAAEFLQTRQVSVSALIAVKKALTRENHAEILNRCVGLTEDEAEVLGSQYNPLPRRQDSVRVVHSFQPAFVASEAPAPSASPSPSAPNTIPPERPQSPARQVQLVLTKNYDLHVRLTPEVNEQLDAVKNALSHRVPNGNLNELLSECFRITLEVCERRKLGAPPSAELPPPPGPGRESQSNADSIVPPGPGSESRSNADTFVPPGPSCESRSTTDVIVSPSPSRESRANSLASGSRDSNEGAVSRKPETAGDSPVTGASLQSSSDSLFAISPSPGGLALDFKKFEDELKDRSRWVPVAVRWPVWIRDGGRCSFVGNGGHRCESKHQLEFDHWRAFSLGGEHSVENCRLLCSRHNRFEAERVLGARLMRKYFDRAA